MKRHLVLFLALMLTVGTSAQDTRKLKTISLTTGVNVTFEKNEVDSVVAVLDAAGDTLGVKVYCAGAKGKRDFLRRYITRMTWWETAPIVTPEGNTNRNSTADLKKNREGWRLEFPRFYQGTNQTYEITHSTPNYGITYSLEWDGTLKANRWTCYELYAGNMQRNVNRQNDFREDSALPVDA